MGSVLCYAFSMPTRLDDLFGIARRVSNPRPFLRHILKEICTQCVQVLKENMYGQRLPEEWEYKIDVASHGGTATVSHRRLEADRDTWEIIFHAHNHGSRRYMIYPVNALALSWVQDGQRFFSKGHEVGGIQPKHFAEKCDRVILDYQNTLHTKWDRWVSTGHL